MIFFCLVFFLAFNKIAIYYKSDLIINCLWIDFDSESNDSGFGDAKGQAAGWGGGWSGVVPAWPAQRQAQKNYKRKNM